MPTERFLHLPEAKRKRITEAAYSELARVSYDQISINKIIQAAEIPRGSFYQYFRDKQDLLEYVMEDFRLALEGQIRESLVRSGGDVFAVARDVLDKLLEIGADERNYAIFKNVFSQIRVVGDTSLGIDRLMSNNMAQVLYPEIDTSSFRQRDRERVLEALELIMILLRNTIAQIFFDFEKKDRIMAGFTHKLAMLQHGILID